MDLIDAMWLYAGVIVAGTIFLIVRGIIVAIKNRDLPL